MRQTSVLENLFSIDTNNGPLLNTRFEHGQLRRRMEGAGTRNTITLASARFGRGKGSGIIQQNGLRGLEQYFGIFSNQISSRSTFPQQLRTTGRTSRRLLRRLNFGVNWIKSLGHFTLATRGLVRRNGSRPGLRF